MTVREVARRLRAWEAGKPLPRYDTLHHAVVAEEQALIVAFIRMAGESRPWGIAWGHPNERPKIRTVPDGRVRDDVAVLCADFAEDLLAHMRVHNWTYDPVDQNAGPGDLRQVWLPNGQHVAMLHQLSYTYSQTKFGGTNQDILRAFGRLAGWMFRDTSRRGHQHTVNASAALNEAYSFPAQDARTAHLGYQLAWLESAGDRPERMAAAARAEGFPVSPTLDPALERDNLSPLVQRLQAKRRDGAEVGGPADDVAAILTPELSRRWELTTAAHRLLANSERPTNAGVSALIDEAHGEFWFQHQRMELRQNDPSQGPAYVAHPETDFHGSSAASRYLIHAAADEAYIGNLIHDDPELFVEALDAGKALRAKVEDVVDVGIGRQTVPQWVLSLDPSAPNRLRENGRLAPYGSKGHEATIVGIESRSDALLVRIEWTGRKTRALVCGIGTKPADPGWIEHELAFVLSDAADLTRRRSSRVWKAREGPGAWLTHGNPPVPVEITDDDGGTGTVALVDDVTQIVDRTQL